MGRSIAPAVRTVARNGGRQLACPIARWADFFTDADKRVLAMEWLTTSTILQRLREPNDQSMWNRFCKRFRRPLVAFARRYGLPQAEAEDLAQDTLLAFTQAYRAGKFDREKGRLSSWLFGIAYRQIAAARRKNAAQRKKQDARGGHSSFWQELPAEHEASQAWDTEWEQAAVNNCMRQLRRELSEQTYRAFDSVVRQGRTADEAAADLGVTRNVVYVAKHRALKRLRELIVHFENPFPEA